MPSELCLYVMYVGILRGYASSDVALNLIATNIHINRDRELYFKNTFN